MAKVLIVDDNSEHVSLVRRVLAACGYEVMAAGDGETGLQTAIEHHPDIIMLDLGLPDVDGQTLLGYLRQAPELAGVPIVAVTAWPVGTAPQMVEAYGFDGYISKPLKFSTLGEQIATYLQPEKVQQ
jgi:CheY-like chemotaxis protein